MSNNIYDILKKMENLEAPKQTLTEGKKAKPDYIDIDKDGDKTEPMKKAAKEKSKGAVAEAVARVEKKLAEKYLNHKKKLGEESDMIRKVIPVGVIDGPGGYEEAQKRIKDHESSKVKRQELPGKELPPVDDRSRPADKPKTKEVDESGLQAYLGKKKYGEQGMQALQKAGREGASKEKMARIRAQHDKMDEGIANFDDNYGSPEIDRVMSRQGSEDFSKKSDRQRELDAVERLGAMMHDEREQRAYKDRTAPGIINKVKDYFDYDKPNPAYGPKFKDKQGTEYDYPYGNPKTKSYNEDMLSPAQKKFAALAKPKDKITYADKIAGAKKKTEGNKFSGNLAKARAQGLKRADLDGDGDMEPVREGWDEMMKAAKERSGPQPRGGSGIKQGTRYGGGRQTDDPDTDNETGEVAKKGRGRPKKDKFAR
jgi:hypothetical protein